MHKVSIFHTATVICRSSKLRTGDHTLFLWEVDRSQLKVQKAFMKRPIVEQEEERFMSILAGPPANNPSHTAVRVVMGLETASTQHIIHPSTSVDSTEDYFRCVIAVSMVTWHCLLYNLSLYFREHKEARNSQLHKHFKTHLKLEFKASSWNREPFCVNSSTSLQLFSLSLLFSFSMY